MPDQVRHDESGLVRLQFIVNRSSLVLCSPSDKRDRLSVPIIKNKIASLREAQALADDSGLVFSPRGGKPLGDETFPKTLKSLSISAVPHGFRSSFRDWAQECTNASWALS